MSAAAKKATNELVSGLLDTPELAQGFVTPLTDISKCGVSKVVVNFSDEGIKINGINDNRNCICLISYTDGITSKINVNGEYSLGVYELPEFIGITKIFSNGFDLTINSNKTAIIEHDNISYDFLSSDVEAIRQGPSSLSAKLDWFSEFKWESAEFASFNKALGCLSQDYVRFEGKKGSNTVNITICDKDIRTSTFRKTVTLEDENENDFKIVLNKQNLQPIVSSSIKNLKVQLSDKLVYFYGVSEYHEMKCYASVVEC